MDGFQDHFSNLYNDTSGRDEATYTDGMVNRTTECNDTLQFCDNSRACGSGTGANSASLIVRCKLATIDIAKHELTIAT